MAGIAGDRPMRTLQGESRLRVIEPCHVFPLLSGMADHTSLITALGHALGKLSAMRILMARGAGKIVEVVRHRAVFSKWFVAIDAGYRYVSSG